MTLTRRIRRQAGRLLRALKGAARRVYAHNVAIVYELTDRIDLPKTEPKTQGRFARVNLTDPGEFAAVRTAMERFGDWEEGEIRRRIDRGDDCFVIRDGQIVATWMWSHTGTRLVEYVDYEIPLKPDEVALQNAVTLPEYRGCGFYVHILNETARYHLANGVNRIVADTQVTNKVSQRGLRRAGYRHFMQVSQRRVLGKHFAPVVKMIDVSDEQI